MGRGKGKYLRSVGRSLVGVCTLFLTVLTVGFIGSMSLVELFGAIWPLEIMPFTGTESETSQNQE